jgi:signal transduction histidine kinase/ligand-binding sensor domain-containing protein/CheY-like chemotaxis protein/AraC-like DNA-binding protein
MKDNGMLKLRMWSLVMVLILFITGIDANNRLVFKHLTFKSGLPYNRMSNVVFQDSFGFIWIGSDVGLHRFNGSDFMNYYCQPDTEGGLSGNEVKAVFEDKTGNLWVGTSHGLDLFIEETESFQSIPFYNEDDTVIYKYTLPVRKIFANTKGEVYVSTHFYIFKLDAANKRLIRLMSGMKEGIENIIFENVLIQDDSIFWIGTTGSGLLKYNLNENTVYRIDEKKGLQSDLVNDIETDAKGNIWVGTTKGIDMYNPFLDTVYNFVGLSAKKDHKIHINDLCSDRNGNIWAATDGYGLLKCPTGDMEIENYTFNEFDNSSLLSNKVNQLFVDKDHNLWLMSKSYGISVTNLNKKWDFHCHTSVSGSGNCLSYNVVNAFVEGNDGKIWIGTDGGGLDLFDPKYGQFTHFKKTGKLKNEISSNTVLSLLKTQDNLIWIGTYGGGLCVMDPKNGKFKTYLNDPSDPNSISGNNIASLVEDQNGDIIALTIGNGISILDRKKDRFTRVTADIQNPNGLSHNGGSSLYRDKDGHIWIGTYYGLNRWDRQTGRFVRYFHNNEKGSISSERILSIYEDRTGQLWVGTDRGLNKFRKDSSDFILFTEQDGLINNVVNAIVGDESGNLWIGTNAGISKMDIANKTFENFDRNYGLPGNAIVKGAVYQCSNGQIFFGGIEGFNYFFPWEIKKLKSAPKLYIDNLKIFDKTVKAGEVLNNRVILEQGIYKTKEITLGHKESSFSIAFAVMDFMDPEKMTFNYMMEGFDKEWRTSDHLNRKATYTNLDPGRYVFKVTAHSNIILDAPSPAELIVNVRPPWYKTWWAIACYLAFVTALFWLYLNILESRMKLKKNYFIEKLQHEKEVETNNIKLNFFTNITHEFRTPLTLIMGPLDRLMEKYKKDTYLHAQLNGVKQNSNRLLGLINELLDLRKLEEGSMKLKATRNELNAFLEKTSNSFVQHARIHNIRFKRELEKQPVWVWFDKNKMEKVFYNLLSNAFKFTPDGGSVSCRVKFLPEELVMGAPGLPRVKEGEFNLNAGHVLIEIEDSGVGVPIENMDEIYKRYFSTEQNQTQNNSGIGLSLCKEIVELHHGGIEAVNNQEKGACFKVMLLLGNQHFSKEEIIGFYHKDAANTDPAPVIVYDAELVDSTDGKPGQTEKSLVLIVEDNPEVRQNICDDLHDYDIIEATNGAEALKLAIEKIPDLVLSDVMMPGMSGKELCQALKTDQRTSHIPVVLLTALSGVENRINGLETGADAYISKPYHSKHLRVRVQKLIELRMSLSAKYGQKLTGEEKVSHMVRDIDVPSYDDIFLQRAVDVVEKHLGDSSFEIEDLCREMGMNYLQMYRKVKALTDMTLKNFILTIRLKSAKKLLAKGKFTVAEVGYEVGFSSPAYFTKCFRKAFGFTPSEFKDDLQPTGQ